MLRLIVIGVVCTLLLIPIAGFSSNIISNQPLLVVVSVGIGYFIVPAYLLHIWPAKKVKKVSMEGALWTGELVTTEFEVREVAQIEEIEDEGLHFLVATETGQTLYLSGQYLYGLVERGIFPSQRVRVFRNRLQGWCYGIEPIGQPLESWPLYDTFSRKPVRAETVLEDGKFYASTIAGLVSEFGFQLISSSAGQATNVLRSRPSAPTK